MLRYRVLMGLVYLAEARVMNVERYCVVCGMGSSRDDWQGVDNPACDNHSPEEVKAAMQAKVPAPSKASKTPKAPPAPSPSE